MLIFEFAFFPLIYYQAPSVLILTIGFLPSSPWVEERR